MAAAAVAHIETTRMTIDVPARCQSPRTRVTAPITLPSLAHRARFPRYVLPHRDPAHDTVTLRSRTGVATARRRQAPRPRPLPVARGVGSRPPDPPRAQARPSAPPPRAAARPDRATSRRTR